MDIPEKLLVRIIEQLVSYLEEFEPKTPPSPFLKDVLKGVDNESS
jgi:hypothetical protein